MSLTEKAYQILEEQIVTLQLAPGSVTSEALLSEQFGIGRMPIREALHRLARERLVQIIPRRGLVVSEINVLAQMRLLELRREVERLLARCAARRASAAQRVTFRDIAMSMEDAAEHRDGLLFLRRDREFNVTLLDAARNDFASSAMSLMNGLSRRFWYKHYEQFADLRRTALLHADVAKAIASGEDDLAADASDRLIDYMEDLVKAIIASDI